MNSVLVHTLVLEFRYMPRSFWSEVFWFEVSTCSLIYNFLKVKLMFPHFRTNHLDQELRKQKESSRLNNLCQTSTARTNPHKRSWNQFPTEKECHVCEHNKYCNYSSANKDFVSARKA